MQYTREVSFYAGHRNEVLQDKCSRLHGHQYTFGYTIKIPHGTGGERPAFLFSDLERLIDEPIRQIFDHTTLLNIQDPMEVDDFSGILGRSVLSGRHPVVWMFGPTSAEHFLMVLTEVASQIINALGTGPDVDGSRLPVLIGSSLRETRSTTLSLTTEDITNNSQHFHSHTDYRGHERCLKVLKTRAPDGREAPCIRIGVVPHNQKPTHDYTGHIPVAIPFNKNKTDHTLLLVSVPINPDDTYFDLEY